MDTTRAARRVAAVAVLLAVTLVGLRARGTFSHAPDSAAVGATGAVLAVALAAAEGVALIAFIVVLVLARPQRQEQEQDDELWRPRFPWWAKTLAVLVALAALVTPFAVLFTRKTSKRPAVAASVAHPGHRLDPVHAAPSHAGLWPVIAGMVIAVALVLVLTLRSRRGRQDGPRPRQDRRVAALARSLAAGRAALAASPEPRAAIISCYAAMERGFAAAGSAPAAADTPAEVLARATGAGIVSSPPAEALTGLFRRARYSTEPMTNTDSDAAAAALARMHAELAQP
jgi:hypothetical protein